MFSKVDLHIHTNFSDGFHSPIEVINFVAKKKISVISITDHDTIDGIKETISVASDYGIEVIPGIELSSELDEKEIHILGYFIDIDNSELQTKLKFFKEGRTKRAEKIVNNLNDVGVNISFSDVETQSKNSVIGRPHIAQALLNKGYVSNLYEAFNKFLNNDSPVYEKKNFLSVSDAVKIIRNTGGLAFLAHPGKFSKDIIQKIINQGIDGIEIHHPMINKKQKKLLIQIAEQNLLLTSGGSDFHGGKRNDIHNLGKYFIDLEHLNKIKERINNNYHIKIIGS